MLQNIILGSGCEDLIIRLSEIITNKRLKVLIATPTFYRISDNLKRAQKKSFEDIEKIKLEKFQALWVVNPNPLTGKVVSKKVLISLIKNNPKTLFILDETAIFFLTNWKMYSLLNECKKYKNIMVLTSLGKMHAATGLRIGFAAGNKELLKAMQNKGLTFPISSLSEYLIRKILSDKSFINNIRRKIKKNKTEVENILSTAKNIEIKPSVTNCVFCRYKENNLIYRKLLRLGIVSLNLDSQEGIKDKGWVRITIHSSKIKQNNLINKLTHLIHETKN